MRHLVLLCVSVLLLAACKGGWDPSFMPSGYAYHKEEYKAPPGPKSKPCCGKAGEQPGRLVPSDAHQGLNE